MIFFILFLNLAKNSMCNQNDTTRNISSYLTIENARGNINNNIEKKTYKCQKHKSSHLLLENDLFKHNEKIDLLIKQIFAFQSYYNDLIKKKLRYNLMNKFSEYKLSLEQNDCKKLRKLEKTIYETLTPLLNFIKRSLQDLKYSILSFDLKPINSFYYNLTLDFITDTLQLCDINCSGRNLFRNNPKSLLLKYAELQEKFNTTFKKINMLFLFNLFQDSVLFEIQMTNFARSRFNCKMENIKAYIYLLIEKETFISQQISQILEIFLKDYKN